MDAWSIFPTEFNFEFSKMIEVTWRLNQNLINFFYFLSKIILLLFFFFWNEGGCGSILLILP
jgi:hypothetical protein